jgi:hypothetical protein
MREDLMEAVLQGTASPRLLTDAELDELVRRCDKIVFDAAIETAYQHNPAQTFSGTTNPTIH